MRDGDEPTPDEPTGTAAPEKTATSTHRSPTTRRAEPPSEPASVHVIVMEDRTRIVVSGEVDADLAPDLQEATSDAEATGLPIEVDAQHVSFMDSSGIAFLARLASRSSEKVRVLHAPDPVRFLLEVTRIGELLVLVDEDTSEPSDDGGETAGAARGAPSIGGGSRGGPPDDAA